MSGHVRVRDRLVTKILERRKRSRLPEIVDRQKERLRIRFGIEVRKEEMERRKDQIEVEQGQGSMYQSRRTRRPVLAWTGLWTIKSVMYPFQRKDCKMGEGCCKTAFRI